MQPDPNDQIARSSPDAGGIVGFLRREVSQHTDEVALVGNRSCRCDQLTYGRLFRLVEEFAAGLLELGIGPGDHVGIVSENCDAWLIVNLALLSIGAVDVPRGGDAPGEEVRFCLDHSQCRAVVLENASQVQKLVGLEKRLAPVIVMKGDAPADCKTFDEVVASGQRRLTQEPDAVSRRTEDVHDGTLATIIYTSGTTGNPKGVMLTHGNVLHNVRTVPGVLGFRRGQRFLSFLPSWHSFERTVEYVVLSRGVTLHYSNKRTLKQDLVDVKPHFIAAVPRVYEVLMDGVIGKISQLPGWPGKIARAALSGSERSLRAWRLLRRLSVDETGATPGRGFFRRIGWFLTAAIFGPAHALADRLVYARLRAAFGGQLEIAVSGGGPLPWRVDEFLTRAGLPLRNGYGLTETSPVVAVRPNSPNRVGTIGPPIPFTEIRIVSPEGVVLGPGQRGVVHIRGPQVMAGYFANPEATRRALVGDGWFDSGDSGLITTLGDVVILGRVKDTIVLSGGENIEPERIEAHLTASPLIQDAILVGHGKKALGVLIVPALDVVASRLGRSIQSEAAAAADPEVLQLLRDTVASSVSRDKGFRSYEMITAVDVLPRALGVDDGTLTATFKKRRAAIEETYRDRIEALFRTR